MASRCATARKIAVAALLLGPAWSAHAGDHAEASTCHSSCTARADGSVVRSVSAATAQVALSGGPFRRDYHAPPVLSRRMLEAPHRSTDRAKHPAPAPRGVEAVEDGPTRNEANTAEPFLPNRGIPIPTVHIGVLPKPDRPQRAGPTASFEVPGESPEDAHRRRTLMHICIGC